MIEPEEPRSLAWRWTLVYVLNLLLPLPLGLWLTFERGGMIGMLAAVLVCWLVGVGGCYQLPRATRAVTDGAIVVGMFQVFPVCHLPVGAAAVIMWEGVAGYPTLRASGWREELGGFVVTLLTALPLLLGAWALGGGPGLLFAPSVARTPDEADYIDPELPPGHCRSRLTTDTPGASGSASDRPAGCSPRTAR